MKGCPWGIFNPNHKMIIPEMKINLREEGRPFDLIEEFIYSTKWITILYSNFIEMTIIDTNVNGSIIIFTNSTECPNGICLAR